MFTFSPRDRVFDFRYFPPLIAMAREEGVDVASLLRDTQIPESALWEENYKVCVLQLEALMLNIVELCRPGIALDYGTRLNLSAFGIVGYAALSSPTARDALSIANQYMPIVLPLLDIRIEEKQGQTFIVLEMTYPVKAEVEKALLEAALASLYTMAKFVLLDKMPTVKLEVKHNLASYHQAFVDQPKLQLRGGREYNRIIIPSDVLDEPLPLANHGSFNMSVKQCDELMEQLPEMDRSLSTGIQRRLLHFKGVSHPSQEDIAKELFMSVRTLHRLLKREGTSFREISNETITLRARHMLEQDTLSISQIAQELGYSDAANFTRAFRTQTGMAPSEYRQSMS
ncbi:AraC family transcriptional regulator [Alkalimarinus coralli]|uniref:AraC family transcriptional regulator n=1 Tax=Alkalimarinus coralli TaxID=2935863 RepID=UPI00202B84B0|nr:AraC family transcriptional regulator [Alkalimarinus coralli]